MIPDIDSRLSRNILKSISYGLPLAEVVPDHTYAQLETRLGELKRRYLELRISHGARELPFSNYLFYLILQSRHQEFDFKLRQGNSVVTNIHRFKSKGRILSLTTLLLADAVNAKSELELKHPDIPQLDRHARDIERWLAAGNVMPPSERALRGLVEALERAAGEGRPLHLVSAVCPDYSHSSDAEGKPRYTFERVGDQPGLAGAKLVSAGQAVAELARARQVEIRHAILGGEFEYLSFNRNPATGETREGFLGKVERQLERIAGPCPARPRPARSSRCAAARTAGTGPTARSSSAWNRATTARPGWTTRPWNRSSCRACRSTRNGSPASRASRSGPASSPRPPSTH